MGKWAVVLAACGLATNAVAATTLEVAAGSGVLSHGDGLDSARVALAADLPWQHRFDGGSELALHLEGSLGAVRKDGDTLKLLAVSPLLQWRFPGARVTPFVEAGIGAAWFSGDRIGDIGIGQHFQFMNRLGGGLDFGAWTLTLRYLHYSQANMATPNDGIDLAELGVAARF